VDESLVIRKGKLEEEIRTTDNFREVDWFVGEGQSCLEGFILVLKSAPNFAEVVLVLGLDWALSLPLS
jgi:hypothetical protein